MQKISLFIVIILAGTFTYSQTSNAWTQKADLGTDYRSNAVGFSIGDKGYIGLGNGYATDFWEYDPSVDTWTQKANFEGEFRAGAVGLSIGSKGYIGTGYSFGTYLKDFWEYDPVINTWTQKSDFGGSGRYFAVGFSIGDKGYLGTGVYYENYIPYYQSDFWEYDPSADKWIQKAGFNTIGRAGAIGFSIGDRGYLGTGYSNISYKDFWEYNPVKNKWIQKADIGKDILDYAVGFSIGTKGYVGTGLSTSGPVKDFWEYDPAINTWSQKADFGGSARWFAVGFSIGGKGYIGTGADEYSSSKDFWEYTPENICPEPVNLKVVETSDSAAFLKWTIYGDSISGFRIRYRIVNHSKTVKRYVKGSNHIVLTDLIPNTTYEWQIRTNCNEDSSIWVTGSNFTTTSSSAFSTITSSISNANSQISPSFQVMPNPNNGSFNLQMHLPVKAASTTLSLYNNLGVKIWQQNAGMLSGSVIKNIALENKLTAGVYIMVIQHGDERLKQKVVVVK